MVFREWPSDAGSTTAHEGVREQAPHSPQSLVVGQTHDRKGSALHLVWSRLRDWLPEAWQASSGNSESRLRIESERVSMSVSIVAVKFSLKSSGAVGRLCSTPAPPPPLPPPPAEKLDVAACCPAPGTGGSFAADGTWEDSGTDGEDAGCADDILVSPSSSSVKRSVREALAAGGWLSAMATACSFLLRPVTRAEASP
jgi:hypothetical protein